MNSADQAAQMKAVTAWDRRTSSVIVPDNVRRVHDHEPCRMCGTRAGLPCRHRKFA